jgi:Concanavalin A-like lectin/glucanases superfamily/Chaperone of endosialidase
MKKIIIAIILLVTHKVDAQIFPVAEYDFNGTINDVSGNGNTGIPNLGVNGIGLTYVADGLGNPTGAIRFDGDDMITVPNNAMLSFPNGIFTLYARVRPAAFNQGTCHGNRIINKGVGDNITGWYAMQFSDAPTSLYTNCSNPVITANQTFEGYCRSTSSFSAAAGAYAPVPVPGINLNQWYCVAVTCNGSQILVYVDGVLASTQIVTGTVGTNTDSLTIGGTKSALFRYYFTGDIDNIKLYNTTLTLAAINAMCPPPICPDLCNWTVAGNNINLARNIFGTLSNDDVRIQTNNLPVGIITNTGNFGQGTQTPISRTHVSSGIMDDQLSISGTSPSIKIFNEPFKPSALGRISMPASPSDYVGSSQASDMVIQNTSNVGSLLFATNLDNANNGLERVKIDNQGFVGINTVNSTGTQPTSFLHVNCINGNGLPNNSLSDVRFENLEEGRGKILVIDSATGYVYRSTFNPGMVGSSVSLSCSTIGRVPRVAGTGTLGCSQIFDNGTSVGIATTGPFGYSGISGLTGPTLPPSSGTVRLEVNGVTRSLAFFATSDANLKTSIMQLSDVTALINKTNGVSYEWNDKAKEMHGADNSRQIGYLAQELATVLPEAVIVNSEGEYAVNYNTLVPIITENLKLNNAKLEFLSSEIEKLRAELELGKSRQTQPNEPYNFKIYPNPTSGLIVIEQDIPANTKTAELVITTAEGKLVKKISIGCKGKCQMSTNVSDVASGALTCTLVVDKVVVATQTVILLGN